MIGRRGGKSEQLCHCWHGAVCCSMSNKSWISLLFPSASLLFWKGSQTSLFIMGNTVCRFPETLDQVSVFVCVYLCVMVMLTQTGSGLSVMRSLQRFLPAVGPYAHTNKHTQTKALTHTHTQLVFLSLVTLAGLRRLRMVFTSTHLHLAFHLNWFPAHLSLSFLSLRLPSHLIYLSTRFHLNRKVMKVLNLNRSVFPASTCHDNFGTVMSE